MSKTKFFNYKPSSSQKTEWCGRNKLMICPPRVLSLAEY